MFYQPILCRLFHLPKMCELKISAEKVLKTTGYKLWVVWYFKQCAMLPPNNILRSARKLIYNSGDELTVI